MSSWPTYSPIQDGTPVDAGTVNSVLNALNTRIEFLRTRYNLIVDTGEMEALVIQDAVLQAGVAVGSVVFYNGADGHNHWEYALADAVAETGIEAFLSSYASGIVIEATGATGKVLFCGRFGGAAYSPAALVLETGEEFREGPYYLSATEPGAMTAHKPAIAVYVGTFFDTYALVNVQVRDLAEAHTHAAFPLYSKYAGHYAQINGAAVPVGYLPDQIWDPATSAWVTPTQEQLDAQVGSLVLTGTYRGSETTTYTVTRPYRSSLLTWESSDAEEGSGTIPYNKADDLSTRLFNIGTKGVQLYFIAHDGDPSNAYPAYGSWTLRVPDMGQGWVPTRFDAAFEASPSYEYNIGYHSALNQVYPPLPLRAATLTLNGVELPSLEFWPDNPAYALTQHTLYWYSADAEHRPWTEPDAPDYESRQLVFHMTRLVGGNSSTVTSLRPRPGSPLRIRRLGTMDDATSGDLEADLELALATDAADAVGYKVVKETVGNKLKRGNVVERIQAGDGLEIVPVLGQPLGQGTVIIRSTETSLSGAFDTVALENAKQDKIGLFPYIKIMGRASGVASAFTANFQVPYSRDPAARYRALVYATVFGETGFTGRAYAGLLFTYSVLPDFYADMQQELPETQNLRAIAADVVTNPIAIPFGKDGEDYAAYDPLLIHNDTSMPDQDLVARQALGSMFPVVTALKPGDTVAIRFAGAAVSPSLSDSEYMGNVGFLNLRWKLVRVEA